MRALAVLVMAAIAGLFVPAAAQAAITPDVAITIKAANSNLCLNISKGSKDPNTPLVQYVCGAYVNDKFRIVPKGTGTFQIVANFSGQCLNVFNGNDANDTPVNQYPCSDTATNNLWRLQPVVGKTTFQIVSVDSGKCLNVYKGNTTIDTPIHIYTCANSAAVLNEQYYFPPATSGSLAAPLPAATNTPVYVAQGGSTAGVGPLVYSYMNNNGQLRRGYQANPEVFNEVVWQTVTQNEVFTGHPMVATQADGKVQVAAQNAIDGDLRLSTQSTAGTPNFADWQDVGGSTIAQPVTGKLPNGKLVTFALVGGKLWHLPQDGTNVPYGLWRYIGGTDLVGEPAVVVTATGLRVYALNSAGALQVANYNDGKLGDFASLGGTGLTGTPGVMVRPGYVNRIVMRTTDGSVVTKLQRLDGTYESDWTTIPGVTAAGNPSALLDPQSGRTSIVVRATDDTVWFVNETGQSTGQWNAWIQPSTTTTLTDPVILAYHKTGGETWAYTTRPSVDRVIVTTTNSSGTPEARVAGARPTFTEHTLPTPPTN